MSDPSMLVLNQPVLDLAAGTSEAPYGTAEWWRDRLSAGLQQRCALVDLYEDYAEGRHSLAFVPSKLRTEMGAMLAACADNYMPMVLEASVERLSVSGFQPATPDEEGARLAWDSWCRNGLDEHQQSLWMETAKHGESYLLVWREQGAEHASVTVEHPREMIVCRDSMDRTKVVAALKQWRSDTGETHANLYLPGKIFRYRRGDDRQWSGRIENGVPAESDVPADVGVPVVPIVNNPSMLPSRPPRALIEWPHGINQSAHIGLGRSDMADVISTQDSLNSAIVDGHSTSRYQGFRVRYAIGMEEPVDENGDPVPVAVGPGALLIVNYDKDKDPEPRIGDLEAGNLDQHINWIVQRQQSLSSRTRVPVHYLLSGRIQLPSGEALDAAEAGLTMKIRGKTRSYGPAAARAQQLVFAWEGDMERAKARLVTQWDEYQHRTEAEHVDAVGKKVALLGLPKEQGLREVGYSQDTLAALRPQMEAEARQQMQRALAFQPAPPMDPSSPPDPAAPQQ